MPRSRRITRRRCCGRAAGALAVALLAGGLVCGPALGQAPKKRKEHYKQQVEQLEQAWRTAQIAGDAGEMDKLLADDYVGITMTGQVVTKMQQLDRIRNRDLVLTRVDLDDVKVKLIGTTAVVTSLASVDGTNEGVNVHGTYRYTRVYTRLPNGVWKVTNFEATRVGAPAGHEGRHRGAGPPRPSSP